MSQYANNIYEYLDETPSRTPKSAYSAKGVKITEIFEGQPCDECPEVCTGFVAHSWRSTCASCGCARWQHAAYEAERASIRERLGLKDDHSNYDKYWIPPGLDKRQCDDYFAALPPEVNDPSLYLSWSSRARTRQLPAHDLSAAHSHHLAVEHRQQYDDFIEARNEIALDVGFVKEVRGPIGVCRGCDLRINSGEMAVIALKIYEEAAYHPGCFTCTTCGELLVELAYCAHSGNVYCQRHYAEILRPRCNSCDEIVANGDYDDDMAIIPVSLLTILEFRPHLVHPD